MSELRLYDTLSRSKQRLAPLEPPLVRVYSCGPTVYARQHLGNLRTYVFADLLNRSLRFFGFEVRHVINITDVGHLVSDADSGDDKLEKAAREQKRSAWEIAAHWTRVFQADLARLHCRPPDVWCRATDHIAEQIEMIRLLEAKGFTYRVSDGIYFDVSKDPHYGELARLDLAAQATGERIGGALEKRNAADFALWKLSAADGPRREMEWDSPWGRGFPGWHIECSAMSVAHLGPRFDIHTGGSDHIPVHHTNEIAQTENALGVRPWVRIWMHGGWLMSDRAKISKSTGGSVLNLDELVAQGFDPLAFRYFLLSGHYRQQLSYSDEAMRGAQTAWRRLVRHAEELANETADFGAEVASELRVRFRAELADDLNAPRALAVVWEALRSDALGGRHKYELLREWDTVLAIGLAEARAEHVESDAELDALARERDEARAAKNWKRADEIRDLFKARGIRIEDSPQGSRWRRA
ncbi:MAG: cysteine--tRNA ligase [Deltaproteobacteria bacterium]|nr:cysteine--tRNA ligase [Deltaproteobacteria bacterium]